MWQALKLVQGRGKHLLEFMYVPETVHFQKLKTGALPIWLMNFIILLIEFAVTENGQLWESIF